MKCKHEKFEAVVDVHRLTENEGDKEAKNFMADIRIKCTKCHKPFEFIGINKGFSFTYPTTSIDNLELRVPIKPVDKDNVFHNSVN